MLDFPATPYNGQQFAAPNGVVYQYTAPPNIWTTAGVGPLATSPITRTLRSFGAVGNGTTDDKAAIDRAFAAQAASPGMMLDGENLLYASMGKHLMHHSGVYLQNVRFKNLDHTSAGHYFLLANTLAFTRIIGNIVPGPAPTVPGTKRTGILTITSYLIGGPATSPPAYNLGIQPGMRITKQYGGEVISCYVLGGSGMTWTVDVSQTTYSRLGVTNWANSTAYLADARADDGLEPREWKVLVPHTSPAAPTTFAQYRAANPTHWGPVPDIQMNGHGLVEGCTLKNVKVDRNNMLQAAPSSNGMTVYIVGYKNVLVEDLEVWGEGAGRGLQVECSADVKIIRPYIHDMVWRLPENLGSGGEMIVGIFAVLSDTVLIDGHVIKRLEGYANGVPQKGTAYTGVISATDGKVLQSYQNTDGLSVAGCQNVTVCNGETWDVGEGIDVSGTRSHNVRLLNNSYYDCNGYAEKVSSEQWYVTSIGARAYRSGYNAFVVSGSSVSGNPHHITWVDAHAYDTGYYGAWVDMAAGTPNPPLTGANWQIAGFATAGGVINCRLLDCKSHSSYQKYAVDLGGVAAGQYEISNLQSSGYTVAKFADVSSVAGVTEFTPSGYQVSGTLNVVNDTAIGSNARGHARFGTASGEFVTQYLRRDDTISLPLWIQNHAVTNVGDGVQMRFGLGAGSVDPAQTAAIVEASAAEDWSVAANQTADLRFKVLVDGATHFEAFKATRDGLVTRPAAAVAAASNAQAFIKASTATNGLGVYYGAGAPTGMSAAKGSLYTNTTATTTVTRLYVNTDGASAWATLTTSA